MTSSALTPDQITDALTGYFGPRVVDFLDTPAKRREAHRAFQQIADLDGAAVARAWSIGMNPHLDDRAPILAIADGEARQVDLAVAAYLAGTP